MAWLLAQIEQATEISKECVQQQAADTAAKHFQHALGFKGIGDPTYLTEDDMKTLEAA